MSFSPYKYQHAGRKRWDNELDLAPNPQPQVLTPSQCKRFRTVPPLGSPSRCLKRPGELAEPVLPSDTFARMATTNWDGHGTQPKRCKPCREQYGQRVLPALSTPRTATQPQDSAMTLTEEHGQDESDDDLATPPLLQRLHQATQPPLPEDIYRDMYVPVFERRRQMYPDCLNACSQAQAQLQEQCYALVPYQSRHAFLTQVCHAKVSTCAIRTVSESLTSLMQTETEPEIEDPDEPFAGYYQGVSPCIEEVPVDEGMELGMDQ
jgi:hypothetical protein